MLRKCVVLNFARLGSVALLWIAAALKAYQLFTDPGLGVLYGSRWLEAGIVDYELLLSIWLLSGVKLQWGRRMAIATFLSFGCYACFLGIAGKESCGCFGNVHVSPWWTFSIDATIALLLFLWKPKYVKDDLSLCPGWLNCSRPSFFLIVTLLVFAGIPLLAAAVWRPGSESSMRIGSADGRSIILEPEKWIGKTFPLTEYIDTPERDCLLHNSWLILFYRHDCPKCQRMVLQYEWLADQLRSTNDDTHIALVEIPPYGAALSSDKPFYFHGRLSDSKEWLIKTPAEVRVVNGQVIAATTDLVPENQ